MKLPREVPVMILPKATLFPSALLPLYIFEPRYRRMLSDALDSHRMFAVAMQKPDAQREVPCAVVGLGLIRVSVRHPDGTSHLILQGLSRVELHAMVQESPYRLYRVRHLSTPEWDTSRVQPLIARLRELLVQRTKLGLPFPTGEEALFGTAPSLSTKELAGYLDRVGDPDLLADLVSCGVLTGAAQRQTILETLDLEARLQRLIDFLLSEMRHHRKKVTHE